MANVILGINMKSAAEKPPKTARYRAHKVDGIYSMDAFYFSAGVNAFELSLEGL